MIDWLIDLYRAWVDQVIVIVDPSFAAKARDHVQGLSEEVHFETQQTPTGMLDAVLLAGDRVRRSDATRVWITWCDQVAIHPETIARQAEGSDLHSRAPVILPVAHRRDPYVHLERDAAGRIVRILHKREGDAMPDTGESDVGLFSLSRDAFLNDLASFAASAGTGGATGERNFLPFIPWIASRGEIVTFPCVDAIEAVGVNTPEELQRVESYLATRRSANG
jgi:bifunctional N-acetylglucosamine-1-phosphate-uridyltransferase/glucosamine-1-phosphate-acetyltransferase GlmU-like protein